MIIMPRQERRAYLSRLRPYMITSLILFGAGIAIGLMVVSYFPGLADHFEDAIAAFVKTFAGMPRLKLAGGDFCQQHAQNPAGDFTRSVVRYHSRVFSAGERHRSRRRLVALR